MCSGRWCTGSKARWPLIRSRSTVPPDLPLIPMASVHIDQVLSNLLENAAKYAPAGTPITITASIAGRWLQVEVADRGPGIPFDERERVFEKFYRLTAVEATHGGTGLGLAICKYWVEAHGGQIGVRPRPGGGAVFSFTLPLDGRQAPDADVAGVPPRTDAPPPVQG